MGHTPSKPRIPLPKNPEVDVVWSGSRVSPWGEKGSLLPPSHNVSSTWAPSVRKLRRQMDAVNKRQVDG
jgi:hypothetical protein